MSSKPGLSINKSSSDSQPRLLTGFSDRLSSSKCIGEPEHSNPKSSFSSPNSTLHPHGCRVTLFLAYYLHVTILDVPTGPTWRSGRSQRVASFEVWWLDHALERWEMKVWNPSGWGGPGTLHSQEYTRLLCKKWMESSLQDILLLFWCSRTLFLEEALMLKSFHCVGWVKATEGWSLVCLLLSSLEPFPTQELKKTPGLAPRSSELPSGGVWSRSCLY